jgi:predicted ferric reductase
MASTATTSNDGPALEKGMWTAVAIATLILILRVIAKIKIHHFRFDDVLMIVAWVTLPLLPPRRYRGRPY